MVIRGVKYRVATVTDDTHLSLTATYAGTTGTGLGYGVMTPTASEPDGSYLFTGVTPTGQTYFVTATTPVGYTATTPTSFTFTNVTGGTAYLTADFGFNSTSPTYTLRDRVWRDTFSSSVPGTVTATNGSPLVTGSSTVFKNLNAGDSISITGVPYTIASIASDTSLTLTTNYTGTTGGGKAYQAWGTYDSATESGIAGVTVELLDASLNVINTTVTAADGTFSFSGLQGGGADYTTRITDNTGVLADLYGTSSYAIASTRLEANLTSSIDRSAAPSYGYGAVRSIGDTVYNDINGNGSQDVGEPGMAGVVVRLYRDVNGTSTISLTARTGVNITTTAGSTAVTGAAGAAFLQYHAGEPLVINGIPYTIASVASDNSLTLTTNATVGYTGGTWSAPSQGPGTISTTNGAATVTGTATAQFLTYRPGEPITIAGVPYTIASIASNTSLTLTTAYTGGTGGNRTYYGPGDALLATLTTDVNGQYLFAGLPNRSYVVSVTTPPTSYTYIPGTGPLARPDVDATFPGIQLASTISGTGNDLTRDFGFQVPPAQQGGLSGTIWNDVNRDDSMAGETGRFAGVTVDLLSGTTVIATLSTDSSGYYSAAGLAPGTYTVQVTDTLPVLSGYTETVARNGRRTATVTAGSTTSNLNFGYARSSSTFAALSYLRAYNSGGSVVVEWRTSVEVGTVGFHLWRLDPEANAYVQVHDRMLPALVGHPRGGLYRFEDATAPADATLQYALVEVDARGRERTYGPYSVPVAQEAPRDEPPMEKAYERRPNRLTTRKVAQLRTLAAERKQAAAARPGRRGETFKVTTRESGLHYLTAAQIGAASGLSAPTVRDLICTRGLSLSHRSQAVSYLPDACRGLYFYAEAVNSPYTLDNAYRLSLAQGTVMEATPGLADESLPQAQAFPETLHREVDYAPVPAFFHDPTGDFWIWDALIAGYDDTKAMTGQALGVSGSGEASLLLRLVGVGEHHYVQVSLNGQYVGDATWDADGPYEATFPVDPSDIVEGDNSVEVKAILPDGTPYSIVYLNSFDLSYERLYRAAGDQLAFTAPPDSSVTVTGFSSGALLLLDVSDPLRPVQVADPVVTQQSDGTYVLRFGTRSGDQAGRYLAVAAGGILDGTYALGSGIATIAKDQPARHLAGQVKFPQEVVSWRDPVWLDPRQGDHWTRATYILIAPDTLLQAAQSLASYRNGKGTKTVVVELQSIYDEFGGGIAEPQAIRRFLEYASKDWPRRPRHFTLVGKGTFDYRNLLGFGDNLVPTLLVDSPDGLVASDVALGDFSSVPDGVPEVAIGRLPVLSSQELLDYQAKVQIHEDAVPAPWQQRVLLTADNADHAGDFPADSDVLATLVPSDHLVDKVYLSSYTPLAARDAVVQAINEGVGILNYIGHGGPTSLADEHLLTTSDVPSLVNAGRLPVFLGMTCEVGNFAYPGGTSLGEELLLWKDGGAYAVWAPSGLSENPLAVQLDRAFFNEVYSNHQEQIGEAAVAGLAALDAGGLLYMRQIYNLLGEPVARLPQ